MIKKRIRAGCLLLLLGVLAGCGQGESSAGRVFSFNANNAIVLLILTRNVECLKRLGFVVFNRNDNCLGSDKVSEDVQTLTYLPRMLAHKPIVRGNIRLALNSI